jgi:hypothetical protein
MSSDRGSDYKMIIPVELKATYKAFRKECHVKKVEPMKADFLAGDFPHWMGASLQKASDDLIAAQYNLYVAVCLVQNVEPVLKDFLVGEIPDNVIAMMEHVENEVEPDRKERLGACA